MSRRQFLKTGGLALAAMTFQPASVLSSSGTFSQRYVSLRPSASKRSFISKAVDAAIEEAKPKIKDEKLRWMFENCFPNTLDTTVRYRVKNGRPDTFVITGDIDAGLFMIKGKVNKGISLEEADRAIVEELRRLGENEVSAYELQKVVNKFESNDLFSNINYLNKATNLAYYELLDRAENIDSEIEKYKGITSRMLKEVAERAFVEENSSTLYYRADGDLS